MQGSPYKELHYRDVTAREFCQALSGLHARDMRSNWEQGIRDARLSGRAKVRVRVKAQVRVTSGKIAGASSGRVPKMRETPVRPRRGKASGSARYERWLERVTRP